MSATAFEKSKLTNGMTQEELARLAEFIKDRFPAEAAGVDFTKSRGVVETAIELLDRLWRWER